MKKCTCDKELCDEAICIIDFAGNFKHKGFWADWCPNSNRVVFGGHWWNIPDMKIDHVPSEKEVDEYVAKFDLSEGLEGEDDSRSFIAVARKKEVYSG